jgi:hypothetical protein
MPPHVDILRKSQRQISLEHYASVGLLDIESANELKLSGTNTLKRTHTHLCLPCNKYLARTAASLHLKDHIWDSSNGATTADGSQISPRSWRRSWECRKNGEIPRCSRSFRAFAKKIQSARGRLVTSMVACCSTRPRARTRPVRDFCQLLDNATPLE